MGCGGIGKCQPTNEDNLQIYPICTQHVKHLKYLRGWAFVMKNEIDIINIGREYGIMDKILEFTNMLKIKIINTKMKKININDSIPMMEDSDEEKHRVSEEGKAVHPFFDVYREASDSSDKEKL
jgi:hypothetical protein